jgi:hypothetical protein
MYTGGTGCSNTLSQYTRAMEALMYPQCTPRQVVGFWNRVQRSDGCWLWTGKISRNGYGRYNFSQAPRYALAHRTSYEWAHQCSILPGFQIHHLCNVRHCVNPSHLEIVHISEHPRYNSSVTYCKRGHPFDDVNTYVYYRQGRPARSCRTCRRRWVSDYQCRLRRSA